MIRPVSKTASGSSDPPDGIRPLRQLEKILTVSHKTKWIEHGCIEPFEDSTKVKRCSKPSRARVEQVLVDDGN